MSIPEKDFNALSNGQKLQKLRDYSFMKEWWYNRPCLECPMGDSNGEPILSSKICMSCKKD